MAAKDYAAIKSRLWIGDDGSPEAFFKVARIGDLAGPKMKRATIDTTTHDVENGYNAFIGSLKDGGEVTASVIFDPSESTQDETATVAGTGAGGLKYLFDTGELRNMRIALPTTPAKRWAFSALVTAFEPDMKVTDALRASVTFKVSGKPTLEAGAGSGA